MSDFYRTQMGRRFVEGTMPRIAEALERVADALEGQPLSEDHTERIAALWVERMGFKAADGELREQVQSCVIQAIKQALEMSRSNDGCNDVHFKK